MNSRASDDFRWTLDIEAQFRFRKKSGATALKMANEPVYDTVFVPSAESFARIEAAIEAENHRLSIFVWITYQSRGQLPDTGVLKAY